MFVMSPPTLSQEIIDRAFLASNGELGVLPADAKAFLQTTKANNIEVLGWELWIIDHAWKPGSNSLSSAPGYWCGFIPLRDNNVPAIIGGEGDVDETARQLLAFNFEEEILPKWLSSIRVNFTLAC